MEKIVLFHPFIPENAKRNVNKVLNTRWIGQGPKVEEFEKYFEDKFTNTQNCLAVGSGTDALHLSYVLANIEKDDEVIAPLFTCTATNIPLLYLKAKIRFADIDPKTLNINVEHVKRLVNENTKAIVCVHYGGLPCDMTELVNIANQYNIPIIQDSAHAIGARYKDKNIADLTDFSCFSFQAIKTITTGDGGMLVIKDKELYKKAKRLRWFGIDREKKQKGIWENDIIEIGYKYQMNDISAAMGISGIDEFDKQLDHKRELFYYYKKCLKDTPDIQFIDNDNPDFYHSAWLCTVLVENREGLQKKLFENKIESGQVHYRNDRYNIFSEFSKDNYTNMDDIEEKYLVLPMHSKIKIEDIDRIVEVIKNGW
tara:strand:+ start:615 stop:1721 length:1107 start_codon:yes stop_codon:yes gene_type:complete